MNELNHKYQIVATLMKCQRHENEDLKLYCETCKELICRDCAIDNHCKPAHNYMFAKEAGIIALMSYSSFI